MPRPGSRRSRLLRLGLGLGLAGGWAQGMGGAAALPTNTRSILGDVSSSAAACPSRAGCPCTGLGYGWGHGAAAMLCAPVQHSPEHETNEKPKREVGFFQVAKTLLYLSIKHGNSGGLLVPAPTLQHLEPAEKYFGKQPLLQPLSLDLPAARALTPPSFMDACRELPGKKGGQVGKHMPCMFKRYVIAIFRH